jgi:hypothetical protein
LTGLGVVLKKVALRFFAKHFTPFGVKCFLSFRSCGVILVCSTRAVWFKQYLIIKMAIVPKASGLSREILP